MNADKRMSSLLATRRPLLSLLFGAIATIAAIALGANPLRCRAIALPLCSMHLCLSAFICGNPVFLLSLFESFFRCALPESGTLRAMETALYLPVKRFLEAGLLREGEICGCDLVALPVEHVLRSPRRLPRLRRGRFRRTTGRGANGDTGDTSPSSSSAS
jgi:hypothetical protein